MKEASEQRRGLFARQKKIMNGMIVPRLPAAAEDYFRMCMEVGVEIGHKDVFLVIEETSPVWSPPEGVAFGGFSRILVGDRSGWVLSCYVEEVK